MSEEGRIVVLARHGETPWSLSGKHTGRTDIALTARGRKQAEDLAPALRRHTFTRVLTSPLLRAYETCCLAGYADHAERCEDLTEWDYGAYEGKTSDEIETMVPSWCLWTDGAPGGESPSMVSARVDRVIARIVAGEGDALLFAHGHLLRALASRWIELSVEVGGLRLALATGTLSELGYERRQRVIRQWNAPP